MKSYCDSMCRFARSCQGISRAEALDELSLKGKIPLYELVKLSDEEINAGLAEFSDYAYSAPHVYRKKVERSFPRLMTRHEYQMEKALNQLDRAIRKGMYLG